MANTLKVIKPFFVMEIGDTFNKTEDGMYESVYSETNTNGSVEGDDIRASYTSRFAITEDYAKELVVEGYLAEEKENPTRYINVFDEIDRLIDVYQTELKNLDKDMKDCPACIKVEKETVLTNMSTVLNYLASLKK